MFISLSSENMYPKYCEDFAKMKMTRMTQPSARQATSILTIVVFLRRASLSYFYILYSPSWFSWGLTCILIMILIYLIRNI